MEPPSMDAVYQAISALYDNPNAAEKEKASVWLADVQKSIHSWKIADDLLQQKKDVQSCYFAAQTMRTKIQHSFFELPGEAHTSLRDSLIAHLEMITPETNAIIITQLCLALADLALQMTVWQNCVNDLINKFSAQNTWALIEILTVLPQEVDSTTLKLGENRREEIKAELRTNSNMVGLFLKETISNSAQNSHISLKIIKCMTSWIQIKAINVMDIPQNAVIGYCLQVLGEHRAVNALHDAATDCVCTLLHCLEENNNSEEVERLVFSSVAGLENGYHLAVAHEEEEKACNYSRVFTELAESFLEKIIVCASTGGEHFAIKSLELALVCVGHHDYEVAEITFNLWYRLSEELYQRDVQQLTDVFKPHVERLVAGLCRHCQMDSDHTALLEEGDEFYDFRLKVLELIKDVVFIIGSSNCFRQMFLALQGSDISWEQTEAALYVMQAVAKNIIPDEYEVVPKVVEAILAVPETAHVAVRKTCVLLLGELCEWIDSHTECLSPCLQCLLRALQDAALASAAATALQSICKACRGHMGVHLTGLLQIVQSLDTFKLSLEAATGLLRGVASIIGRLPHEQITVAMREAAAVQLASLEAFVKSEDREVKKGTSSDPVVWLDRLAALFRDVEAKMPENGHSHPCLPALSDSWPVLSSIMDKYHKDSRIMERLCRTLRFALRCTGRHAAPLLQPLAVKMVEVYSARGHSCFLYLASILVDEFAAEPACVPGLMEMLQALMPKAFHLLRQPQGLKDNPDTVDDLFRLCIRYLQRAPLPFLQSPAVPSVMECAVLACALDHRDANSSVMKFLFDLAHSTQSRRVDATIKGLAESVLTRYGETLTHALLHASVFSLHGYMLAEVGEVVLELVSWQRRSGVDWLQPAVAQLPQGASAATPQQCQMFHTYALKAESSKEMTRLLRDFARLYQ